ncbi:nucleotidyl transferase AbiEii/AbiGii toxin family protein [Anaeroselena agilis]|uniref:nucleotidyl transferase AbiEii/AbiGii toxin family protein n=1 Tax=Anaeroselena agilis TaxID=3063788 RepID=UPI0039B70048
MNLLEGFQAHPVLRDRFALKGGTALNLFYLDVSRLSVAYAMSVGRKVGIKTWFPLTNLIESG